MKHPVYGKYITRSSKVHAHDEENKAGMGDTVLVAESRPMSKSKSWALVEIVETALRFEVWLNGASDKRSLAE